MSGENGGVGEVSGTGYRTVFGWIVLIFTLLVNVGAYLLLYFRGRYNPLKAYNPVIVGLTTVDLYIGLMWVNLKELGIWPMTCIEQVWASNIAAVVYAIPVIVFSYRLVLVSDYEKQKVLFALSQLAPTERVQSKAVQFVKRHSTRRMVLFICISMLPPFIYLPLFDRFGRHMFKSASEYDWSALHCEYGYDTFLLPYYVTCCYLTSLATYVSYLIWSHKVNDGFGIRRNLNVLILYSNVFVCAWVVISIAVPHINEKYIDAAYVLMTTGIALVLHLVYYRTFTAHAITRVAIN